MLFPQHFGSFLYKGTLGDSPLCSAAFTHPLTQSLQKCPPRTCLLPAGHGSGLCRCSGEERSEFSVLVEVMFQRPWPNSGKPRPLQRQGGERQTRFQRERWLRDNEHLTSAGLTAPRLSRVCPHPQQQPGDPGCGRPGHSFLQGEFTAPAASHTRRPRPWVLVLLLPLLPVS